MVWTHIHECPNRFEPIPIWQLCNQETCHKPTPLGDATTKMLKFVAGKNILKDIITPHLSLARNKKALDKIMRGQLVADGRTGGRTGEPFILKCQKMSRKDSPMLRNSQSVVSEA